MKFMDTEILHNIAEQARFQGTIEAGFRWEGLAKKRMLDPKALEPYGYKVYSQNDEDGIIHEIYRRIGIKNKIFIEFGVQNGLETNTHLLLLYGWKGLWIESSVEHCKEIQIRFSQILQSEKLKLSNSFITKDNINNIFKEFDFFGEIDLLSIDIDGNDYHIWDEISIVQPRVVIIEYNGKLPPDLEWIQPYNESHTWNGSDWHGASLKSLEILGNAKGYTLVGTNLRGVNAFFVRHDLTDDLFYTPSTSEALYNPLRLHLNFTSNHPAHNFLPVKE